MALVKILETVQLESTIDLDFPYYISVDKSNTYLIKVNSDMSYVELYSEQAFEGEWKSITVRVGDNFIFYRPHVEDQNQDYNKQLFESLLTQLQKNINGIL